MKIGGNFAGFNISAKGLSIQRKKMNLIAENLANAEMVRNEKGEPYQRKILQVKEKQSPFQLTLNSETAPLQMNTTSGNHLAGGTPSGSLNNGGSDMEFKEVRDTKEGEIVYMPGNPNADEKGYVKTSNVNVIDEMVDMIAASRSYEANLTAFNSSKQIAKDSLDI